MRLKLSCLRWGLAEVNGEAIYGTTTWVKYGEGPNQITKSGAFNEKEVPTFTAQDVRFTVKDNNLYAICMGWPGEEIIIESLKALYKPEICSVQMLGANQELEWSLDEQKGMTIKTPTTKPCQHAYVFRINRGQPFSV
jgi:alpha-L-fucosidase